MSPDEPPILNNPMWLTPSSCDALPIHSYFGQRHNVTTLQATRTRIYLHQSLIWAGSGWMFIVKWYFANLIHWAGLVVLCCCFAWWQWSSFIHDADYCDNLSTESSAASHWSRMQSEGVWLAATITFAFPTHDTRHGAIIIRLSLSRSEENFLRNYQREENSVVVGHLNVLTFAYRPWSWAYLFIRLKCDDILL